MVSSLRSGRGKRGLETTTEKGRLVSKQIFGGGCPSCLRRTGGGEEQFVSTDVDRKEGKDRHLSRGNHREDKGGPISWGEKRPVNHHEEDRFLIEKKGAFTNEEVRSWDFFPPEKRGRMVWIGE